MSNKLYYYTFTIVLAGCSTTPIGSHHLITKPEVAASTSRLPVVGGEAERRSLASPAEQVTDHL